jgi:hypothetical protein
MVRKTPRKHCAPLVEQFEDRLVPASIELASGFEFMSQRSDWSDRMVDWIERSAERIADRLDIDSSKGSAIEQFTTTLTISLSGRHDGSHEDRSWHSHGNWGEVRRLLRDWSQDFEPVQIDTAPEVIVVVVIQPTQPPVDDVVVTPTPRPITPPSNKSPKAEDPKPAQPSQPSASAPLPTDVRTVVPTQPRETDEAPEQEVAPTPLLDAQQGAKSNNPQVQEAVPPQLAQPPAVVVARAGTEEFQGLRSSVRPIDAVVEIAATWGRTDAPVAASSDVSVPAPVNAAPVVAADLHGADLTPVAASLDLAAIEQAVQDALAGIESAGAAAIRALGSPSALGWVSGAVVSMLALEWARRRAQRKLCRLAMAHLTNDPTLTWVPGMPGSFSVDDEIENA